METKEMIEILRYKAENIKAKIEPEFFNEVADRLEKQAEGWISVKDRLPELNKYVLVTKRNKDNIFYGKLMVDIACYSKKDFKNEFYWRGWNMDVMASEVIAWMPLQFPEPYREVGGIDGY